MFMNVFKVLCLVLWHLCCLLVVCLFIPCVFVRFVIGVWQFDIVFGLCLGSFFGVCVCLCFLLLFHLCFVVLCLCFVFALFVVCMGCILKTGCPCFNVCAYVVRLLVLFVFVVCFASVCFCFVLFIQIYISYTHIL